MPLYAHMDARVFVDGQPLQEYLPPAEEGTEEGVVVRYVEATVGKRFSIVAKWLPGFPLNKAAGLYSAVTIDDGKTKLRRPVTRGHGLSSKAGILSQEIAQTWAGTIFEDSQGLSRRAYYVFGALEISESIESRAGITPEQVKHMGEIRVEICRSGKVTVINQPTRGSKPAVVHEAIPEKVMKGRELKNIVRYEIADPDSPPPRQGSKRRKKSKLWTCEPLDGPSGQPMVFVFKYRNRKLLKKIGCIPRSPSPERDYATKSQEQEDFIRDAKERNRKANLEIIKLREQIARLQATDNPTPETRGTKRGRDDADDEIEELSPAPKRPQVVVDLTEDD